MVKSILEDIFVFPLNEPKKYNIKTPEAIIATTAINNSAILLSNDKKLHIISELKCKSLKLID